MNNLVVIENGNINNYELDDKEIWNVGRPTKSNAPDIGMNIPTISRKHGLFRRIDGLWFYVDASGKNGTVYKNKKIKKGLNGNVRPVMLKDGDTFVFGGDETAVICDNTVWAMFYSKSSSNYWKKIDTAGANKLNFSNGQLDTECSNLVKGTVIKLGNDMAVYMGDATYVSGNMKIIG